MLLAAIGCIAVIVRFLSLSEQYSCLIDSSHTINTKGCNFLMMLNLYFFLVVVFWLCVSKIRRKWSGASRRDLAGVTGHFAGPYNTSVELGGRDHTAHQWTWTYSTVDVDVTIQHSGCGRDHTTQWMWT